MQNNLKANTIPNLEETLADLVHDEADKLASAVNNGGFEEQVQFLKECGWTEEEILEQVGKALAGTDRFSK